MSEEEKPSFIPPEDDPERIKQLLSLVKETVAVYRAAEEKAEKKQEIAQRNALGVEKEPQSSYVEAPIAFPQKAESAVGAFSHEEILFDPPRSKAEVVEKVEEKEELTVEEAVLDPLENNEDEEIADETVEALDEEARLEEAEELEEKEALEELARIDAVEEIEELEEREEDEEHASTEEEEEEAPARLSKEEAFDELEEENGEETASFAEENGEVIPFITDSIFSPASEKTSEEEESLPDKKPVSPQNKTEEWEAITLDSEIDALIAESREKRERDNPYPWKEEGQKPFSSPTVEPIVKEPLSPSVEDAPFLEKEPIALDPGPSAPPRRVRRFSIRLIDRRAAEKKTEPVSVRDAGVFSPLLSHTEEDGFVGTLRPQDFFIADMKEDESLLAENGEYVSRNQIESILTKYDAEQKQLSIRFFLSVFLSALLLVFENLPLFDISRFALFGITPAVAVLLDLCLLGGIASLAYDYWKRGFSEIASLRLGECGLLVLSLLLSLAASIFTLCAGLDLLCALPAACFVSISLYLRRMRSKDDAVTFSELCKSGDKLAAEDIPAVYASEESAALDKHIKDVVRIKKVGFVNGYFRRMKKPCEDYTLHSILLGFGLFAAFMTTILYALLAKEASFARVSSLVLYLLLSLIGSVFLTARRIPFHHLVNRADEMGTAVIGESSAEDYASVDAICFEDVEAYPSRKVRVRQIKIYENGKLDEILYYMASVFSILGGPLDGVFRVSAAELGISENITLLSSSLDGFEASVDGVRITAGKSTFFPKEKIYAYYDGGDAFEEDCGNISVMYVAVDGVINAKFCIEYTVSHQFEANVARLRRYKVAPLLRSFDPNISNLLLLRTLHNPSLQIRAVRKRVDQLYDFAESRIDSGLVSTRGSKELLRTLFLCQNHRRAVGIGRILKMASIPISLALSLWVAVALRPEFCSVYVAAMQLLWLLPPYITSRIYFQKRKKTK